MKPPVDMSRITWMNPDYLGTAASDDPLGMLLPVVAGVPLPPPDCELGLRCHLAIDRNRERDQSPLLIIEFKDMDGPYLLLLGILAPYRQWMSLVAERGYLALDPQPADVSDHGICQVFPLGSEGNMEAVRRFMAAAKEWLGRHPEYAAAAKKQFAHLGEPS